MKVIVCVYLITVYVCATKALQALPPSFPKTDESTLLDLDPGRSYYQDVLNNFGFKYR